MKIVSFEDVRSLDISPIQCYEWASEMIVHKKEAELPPKIHMSMPGNVFCNVMPCLIPDAGEFLALMDGNWITAMRTGAVATHSILLLAKKNFQTIGMIGLGNVARASLLVLTSVLRDRPLTVKLLRYKNQAELFADRFRSFPNISFCIVDTPEECIRGSEVVISCATYFEQDIAQDSWFDEGVLVVPVHTRGFTNCDLFFDKVFADDTGHVDHFKNFEKFRYYAEVSDVVNGKSIGRENDKERIIAYNIGISLHDINCAAQIYKLFKQQPDAFAKLTNANMHDPADKFWV